MIHPEIKRLIENRIAELDDAIIDRTSAIKNLEKARQSDVMLLEDLENELDKMLDNSIEIDDNELTKLEKEFQQFLDSEDKRLPELPEEK